MSSADGQPKPLWQMMVLSPETPPANVETSGSSSMSSASQKSRKAKLAKLKVQQQTLCNEAELALQQRDLEFCVAEVRLEGRSLLLMPRIRCTRRKRLLPCKNESSRACGRRCSARNVKGKQKRGVISLWSACRGYRRQYPWSVSERDPASEVSLRMPRWQRLPEVPTNWPSTLPVPGKRSSRWQAVQPMRGERMLKCILQW